MRNKTNVYIYQEQVGGLMIYTGLGLAGLGLPALAFILWMMSLFEETDPDYTYLLIAWGASLLLFLLGVILKKRSHDRQI